MVHYVKAFAAAIAGAEYAFASEQVVHKVEVLGTNDCTPEDRCTVEIAELG